MLECCSLRDGDRQITISAMDKGIMNMFELQKCTFGVSVKRNS